MSAIKLPSNRSSISLRSQTHCNYTFRPFCEGKKRRSDGAAGRKQRRKGNGGGEVPGEGREEKDEEAVVAMEDVRTRQDRRTRVVNPPPKAVTDNKNSFVYLEHEDKLYLTGGSRGSKTYKGRDDKVKLLVQVPEISASSCKPNHVSLSFIGSTRSPIKRIWIDAGQIQKSSTWNDWTADSITKIRKSDIKKELQPSPGNDGPFYKLQLTQKAVKRSPGQVNEDKGDVSQNINIDIYLDEAQARTLKEEARKRKDRKVKALKEEARQIKDLNEKDRKEKERKRKRTQWI